jgi:acyl carrier protein
LAAYFTAQDESAAAARLAILEIRDRFGRPGHCDFIPVEQMPLTETGEIDRNQLRALISRAAERSPARAAPRTETERLLATIWQAVLGVPEVGIHDNFFELGGDSLLATQLISHLRQKLALELPLRAPFEKPTVAGLARHIEILRLAATELQVMADIESGDREEGRL